MPPTAALNGASSHDAAYRIFDDIQSQFTLSHDALVGITQQFLEDFRIGLSQYNQSMAMMYVLYIIHTAHPDPELTVDVRIADLHL